MFQYVFGLTAEHTTYAGKAYFGMEFFGEGADTLEDAEAKALRVATSRVANKVSRFETGRFRISVRKPCASCKITGIKAGCRRKACPDCKGRGTTDVAEHIFTVG